LVYALGGGAHYNASLAGTAVGFMQLCKVLQKTWTAALLFQQVLFLSNGNNHRLHTTAVSNILWEEVPI
jgi:hypothetical protein